MDFLERKGARTQQKAEQFQTTGCRQSCSDCTQIIKKFAKNA